MGSLGNLGTPRDALDVDFEWFGSTVRANPDLTDMVLADFMAKAVTVDDETPEAYRLLEDLMRQTIHPDDFDTYWRLAQVNRQTSADHRDVLKAVVAEATGRPTLRSSESSDGPKASVDESEAAFVKRVTVGRPDLEVGLVSSLVDRQSRRAG
jgi:hypothetical protein